MKWKQFTRLKKGKNIKIIPKSNRIEIRKINIKCNPKVVSDDNTIDNPSASKKKDRNKRGGLQLILLNYQHPSGITSMDL